MVMRLCILVLVLFVLATGANAFPLTGGNGQVNATVLGMYTTNFSVTQPILILDVLCNDPLNEIALVDSDDKFYQHGVNDMLSFGELPDRGVARRHLIGFEGIPAQTEIKWVRITPSVGDPFSIEWTGVPEIKGTPITVKFYGFKRESRIYRDPNTAIGSNAANHLVASGILCLGGMQCELNKWIVDVKVTNTENNSLNFKNNQFDIVDQFGFAYQADAVFEANRGDDERIEKLMPGESMRTSITFSEVSKLSRPVYLVYTPSNIKMDISAWA